MANVDLSFLNKGKELSYSVEQLQAMDRELAEIAGQAPGLTDLAKSFGITYLNAKTLTDELGLLPAQLTNAIGTMSGLKQVGADGTTQFAVLAKQLGLTSDQMKLLAENVETLGGSKDVVQELTAAMSQLFLLDKVNSFKAAVLEAGKVFENLNAQLKTTLGTQAAANNAMASLQDFAATTPYELTEITEAYVKLKQRGIDPTNAALTNLGDLASSQGKGLDQASEALLDASQSQFERLVEFGIKASSAGDKVSLTFQGVTKQVDKSEKAITAGVLAFGAMEGVAGGMAEKAMTLDGQMSNLADNQSRYSVESFKFIQGPAVAFVGALNSLIGGFFALPVPMQKVILLTTTLGTVVLTSIAALAAFQAANMGVALSTAYSTATKIPAAIATKALSIATSLAAAANGALGVSTVSSAAALAASTPATIAAAAANGTLAASLFAVILPAAVMAAAVISVAAALALVVNNLISTSEGERNAAATADKLALSNKALEEATARREKREKSTAEATVAGAEASRKAALTLDQLSAENASKDKGYAESYAKSVEDKMTWVDKFTDHIKELIKYTGAATATSFVLNIVAKLPLPGPIKNFFSFLKNKVDSFNGKDGDRAERKRSDAEGIDTELKASDKGKAQQDKVKEELSKSSRNLSDLDKGELEAFISGNESRLESLKKLVPQNAKQATDIETRIRLEQQSNEELKSSLKLLEEKAKRVVAVGTAEEQFKAENKKNLEKLTKNIASSEDAGKITETTKKGLDTGSISADEARANFESVANYRSATGDVQNAAYAELKALAEKDTDFKKEQLAIQIGLEEVKGASMVQSEEETARAVGQLRIEQADLDVENFKRILEAEVASGRSRGEVAKKASQDLAKAEADSAKAKADAQISATQAMLKESADKREELESKQAISAKKSVLKAIQEGNKTIEETEKENVEVQSKQEQGRLEEEIATKQKAYKELSQVKSKEAQAAAKELGLEILKLQDKQLGLEIDAVKRAQKKILEEIKKAADKRAQLVENRDAEGSLRNSEAELKAIKKGDMAAAEIDRMAAKSKLELARDTLAAKADLVQKEIDDVKKMRAGNLISQEEADKKLLELQGKLSRSKGDVVANEIALIKLARAHAQAEIQEQQKLLDDKGAAERAIFSAKTELTIAKQRISSTKLSGEDLVEVEKGNALKRQQVSTAAALEAFRVAERSEESLKKLIEAKVIDKRDIETKKLAAVAERTKAEAAYINSVADLEILKVRQAAEARNKAVQDQQRLMREAQDLMSAEQGLLGAQSSARKLVSDLAIQELSIAKELASVNGDSAGADALGIQIKALELAAIRAQRAEIEAQYDSKLKNLELDIKSKELATEQLVLEKTLAKVEAEGALAAAIKQGKSAEEIDILKQRVDLTSKSEEIALKSKKNQDEISGLQRETMKLEKATALNANRGQVRKAEADLDLESAKASKSDSGSSGSGSGSGSERNSGPTTRDGSGTSSLTNSFSTSISGADTAARALGSTFSDTTAALGNFTTALGRMPGAPSGARADGGSVLGGNSYLIGERGPEVVTFGASGSVTSNKSIMAALGKKLGSISADANSVQASTPAVVDSSVLNELTALRRQVADKESGSLNAPVNVYSADPAAATAEALSIIRASRARQYSALG
jgi:hypothetical protein